MAQVHQKKTNTNVLLFFKGEPTPNTMHRVIAYVTATLLSGCFEGLTNAITATTNVVYMGDFTFRDTGVKHHGTFNASLAAHGMGTRVEENGECYSGYWLNGAKHGPGNLFTPHGDHYAEVWDNGILLSHQIALNQMVTNANVLLFYEGQPTPNAMQRVIAYVTAGRFEGFTNAITATANVVFNGVFTFRDTGATHRGLFNSYMAAHGIGTRVEANGEYYAGGWCNGVKHGPGNLFTTNGHYSEVWEHGILVSHENALTQIEAHANDLLQYVIADAHLIHTPSLPKSMG